MLKKYYNILKILITVVSKFTKYPITYNNILKIAMADKLFIGKRDSEDLFRIDNDDQENKKEKGDHILKLFVFYLSYFISVCLLEYLKKQGFNNSAEKFQTEMNKDELNAP